MPCCAKSLLKTIWPSRIARAASTTGSVVVSSPSAKRVEMEVIDQELSVLVPVRSIRVGIKDITEGGYPLEVGC